MMKKRPCKFYINGNCTNGDNCNFSHDVSNPQDSVRAPNSHQFQRPNFDKPPRQFNDNQPKKPCKHFAQGNCQYGDRCHFLHENSEPQRIRRPKDDPVERDWRTQKHVEGDDGQRPNRGERQFNNQNMPRENQRNDRQTRPFPDQSTRSFKDNSYPSQNFQRFRPAQGDQDSRSDVNRNSFTRKPDSSQYSDFGFRKPPQQPFQPQQGHPQQYRRNQERSDVKQTEQVFNLLTQLRVDDFIHFLTPIEVFTSLYYLGIVNSKSITFFPLKLQDKLTIDSAQKKDLIIKYGLIQRAWIQRHQAYQLLVAYKKEGGMLCIAYYSDLLGNSEFVIYLEGVSLMPIIFCHFHNAQSLLYAFCNDGVIRIFQLLDKKLQLATSVTLNSPIECAIQTSENDERKIFLIGLRTGELIIFNNNQLMTITHSVTNMALVDLRKDEKNKKIYLLFWSNSQNSSQILTLNDQSVLSEPIYQRDVKVLCIECIKDHELKNLVLAATDAKWGLLEIFEEDLRSQKLSPLSLYPHQVSESEVNGRIKDMLKIEFVNQNQVSQKFLLIGRQNEVEKPNIELLELIPKQ